jgi:hypothetical protein
MGYRVRIVVDRDFGEQLATLPCGEPVWVVDSHANAPVAHRLRRERRGENHLTEITTFHDSLDASAEDLVIGELDRIDLHHGEYSAAPLYSELEVIGCGPSPKLTDVLGELGFTVESTGSIGFLATRFMLRSEDYLQLLPP